MVARRHRVHHGVDWVDAGRPGRKTCWLTLFVLSVGLFALVLTATWLVRTIIRRTTRFSAARTGDTQVLELAVVGWL